MTSVHADPRPTKPAGFPRPESDIERSTAAIVDAVAELARLLSAAAPEGTREATTARAAVTAADELADTLRWLTRARAVRSCRTPGTADRTAS